ncbi:MAG: hypothetical protein Q7S61_06130 [bacterium]|nr:hypothetical protein [bacterium]
MSRIKIEYSSTFNRTLKKFVKNNISRYEDYSKVVRLFAKDPQHPSLNLEKLKHSPFWTIRLNRNDRIFFIWKSKTSTIFLDVGKHDKYRTY